MENCLQNKCNCESFEVPLNSNLYEIALMQVWEKVKKHFATKDDVLAITKEVEKLHQRQIVRAVQTGEDGPIQYAGPDQIAHIQYENWVESEGLDASGKSVHVYNDSKNALTAAAAAMVIKQIRRDVDKAKNFEIKVCNSGDDGYPSVSTANFNTLYITPGEDNTWTEWIYVEKHPNDDVVNPHFERIGSSNIDLKWVRGNFDKLNADIASLKCTLKGYCDALIEVILENFAKPLKELQAYIKSTEFVTWMLQYIPKASEYNNGLMTQSHVQDIQNLSKEIDKLKTNTLGDVGAITEKDVKYLWDTIVEKRDKTEAAAEYYGGEAPDYITKEL